MKCYNYYLIIISISPENNYYAASKNDLFLKNKFLSQFSKPIIIIIIVVDVVVQVSQVVLHLTAVQK